MTPPSDPDLLESIMACELQVWAALARGDAAADKALLAAEFIGVYGDGIHGRGAHTGQLDHGPSIASYALSDAICRPVGGDHALLVYRADFVRAGGDADRPEVMHVSSLWRRHGAGWINIFSQDTPLA